MLEVAPKPGRDPLGDARFDPALRVDQRVRRRAARSSSWPAGWFACVGRPRRPAHQVLVRLRLFRFLSDPLDELTRRAAREGPESVQASQLGKMLVPGLGPHRVVGEVVPVHVELASDEIHDGRRHELAGASRRPGWRSTQSCRAKPSLLWGRRREPMFCTRSSSLRVYWRSCFASRCGKPNRDELMPARQDGSPCHALSLDVCRTSNERWNKIHGGARLKRPAP